MRRNILIALILLLATVGGVFAQETDTTAGKRNPLEYVSVNSGRVPDDELGRALTRNFTIEWHTRVGHDKPVKYRVSWTVNRKWLSWKQPNPEHGRRGNVFVTGSQHLYINSVQPKITVPLGKTLRVRVRPIYADRSRGQDCLASVKLEETRHGWYFWVRQSCVND